MKKNLKASISTVLALTIMISLIFSPVSVFATAYTVSTEPTWNWYYSDSVSQRSVTLYGYKGTNVNLTHDEIPTTLNGNLFMNIGCNLSTYETDLGNGTFGT